MKKTMLNTSYECGNSVILPMQWPHPLCKMKQFWETPKILVGNPQELLYGKKHKNSKKLRKTAQELQRNPEKPYNNPRLILRNPEKWEHQIREFGIR